MSEYLKFLVYAQPGAGKTFLMGTADGDPRLTPALLIDTEGGSLTIRGTKDIDVVRVHDYGEMVKLIHHLQIPDHSKCKHRIWKSLMLDSFTEYQKSIMQEIVRKSYAEKPETRDPDVPAMHDWNKNAERCRKTIRALRDIPSVHLFVTCLEKENKNENTGIVKILPSLPGQLANEIAGFLDIVGYLRVVKVEEKGADGKKKAEVIRRELVVQPITNAVAKDRSDLLGDIVISPTLPDMLDTALAEIKKQDKKK